MWLGECVKMRGAGCTVAQEAGTARGPDWLTRRAAVNLRQININYESVVLLKLLTMVAVLTHMEACLFWYIGDVSTKAGWIDQLGGDIDMNVRPRDERRGPRRLPCLARLPA